MLLQPKRTKFAKAHKGRLSLTIASRPSSIPLAGRPMAVSASPTGIAQQKDARPWGAITGKTSDEAIVPVIGSEARLGPQGPESKGPGADPAGGVTSGTEGFGLIAKEPARLSAKHIAAAEFALKRVIRRNGQFRIIVFPHIPVTKKPAEVRMGKGKGSVNF